MSPSLHHTPLNGYGAEVDLVVIDGNLVVKPRSRQRYSLDELVDAITPENLHSETETDPAGPA